MNENMMNRSYEVQVEGDSLGRYTAKTFGWMFAGLLVTFIVAVGFAMTGTIFYIYSFRYWPLALLAAELGVVIYLSARIEKMSVGMARSLFFLYAALNGIVFSAYLFAFSLEILWMVFGITALFFGIMALIGWFGNINFTKLRPFMLGGLVFLFFYWKYGQNCTFDLSVIVQRQCNGVVTFRRSVSAVQSAGSTVAGCTGSVFEFITHLIILTLYSLSFHFNR